MAVDTHIFRVSNRTGLAPGKNVDIVEQKLLKFVPKEFLHDAHHWLILHGRYTCTARKPQCWNCMIADLCDYGTSRRCRPWCKAKTARKGRFVIRSKRTPTARPYCRGGSAHGLP
jgi:adenine-specific DNA glycosylase